jgi:hypothetical protein
LVSSARNFAARNAECIGSRLVQEPIANKLVIPSFTTSPQGAATALIGLLLPLLCLGQTAPTLPDPCATNAAAIEAVRAGSRNEASAAWWGFNAQDATDCLQSAIDSGVKKVVVPFMGTEWVVRPIRLRGNLELVFEPGVVVLAKQGEFRGKGDSLFAAADAENITLRGYGATLRMRKKDYQHSPYEKAEWRMTLDFGGCRKIAVEGLRLESSGGDGIYIGATSKQPFCEDVVIRDATCHDHHRQGISVISAVNLLIENCILSGTGGTAPEAGIDFEPNSPGERLKNCVVRNCTMADNTGAGILVYLNPLSRASEPVSLLFENCLVQGGKDIGIGVGAIRDDGPQGSVEFRNCTVLGAAGGGVYLYDKSPDSARVRFINCSWKDVGTTPAAKKDRHPPLLLDIRQTKKASSLGGVDFQDCHIYDSIDRPVLVLEGKKKQSARDIQGTITVHSPFAARTKFEPSVTNVNLKILNIPLQPKRE